MAVAPPIAVVTGLATTPVKGLRMLSHDAVMLERQGVAGNRRFYLIDEHARMVNGKQIGALGCVVGEYDEDSRTLTMTFPEGEVATGSVTLGEWIGTAFFSSRRRGRLVLGPWAAALSAHAGRELRLVHADPARGAVDRGPAGAVSVISRTSIARLEETAGAAIDARRFRMLVEVDGPAAHEEDAWVGRQVRIGGALVAMHGHVGRCLVTSRHPESGIVDLPTLDLLRASRDGEPTTEPLAFGIFGEVLEPGPLRVGDEVTLV